MELINQINFSKLSRKALSLLHQLGASAANARKYFPVSPNEITNKIVEPSRMPHKKAYITNIKQKLKTFKKKESDKASGFNWSYSKRMKKKNLK